MVVIKHDFTKRKNEGTTGSLVHKYPERSSNKCKAPWMLIVEPSQEFRHRSQGQEQRAKDSFQKALDEKVKRINQSIAVKMLLEMENEND
tara:strand:+ start:245 stop:514 length:270 start_codon:yes stop_codon:yes gene_type:complete